MFTKHVAIGLFVHICPAILLIWFALEMRAEKRFQDGFLGFHWPSGINSPEDWEKVNQYGLKRIIIWSCVLLTLGIITCLIPTQNTAILMLPSLVLLIPIVEIWKFSKSLRK